MADTIRLEAITPSGLFYDGEVNMLICKTVSGFEGFMAMHAPVCKLLNEDGEIRIKETEGGDFKVAKTVGGYIDVRDRIILYTDEAEWV